MHPGCPASGEETLESGDFTDTATYRQINYPLLQNRVFNNVIPGTKRLSCMLKEPVILAKCPVLV